MWPHLLAGSALVRPVTEVAEWTVLDAVLVAFAFTDEIKDDLHFLREPQGFYLNGLRHAFFGTTLRCHTDAKRDLWQ